MATATSRPRSWRSLVAAVLALCAPSTPAQEPSRYAPQWQVQSFLADADFEGVTTFFIDFGSSGHGWFATSHGLYRYDGFRWERFGKEDGLPSDHVRCALEARDGRLWVATDAGTGVFDCDGRSFDTAGTADNLAGPTVRRIAEDQDGTLWFCCDQWPIPTVSGGITRLSRGTWQTWTEKNGLPSDHVMDYFRDSDDNCFVLTDRGVGQLDGDRVRLPLVEAGVWRDDTSVFGAAETQSAGLLFTTRKHVYQRRDGAWKVHDLGRGWGNPPLCTTRDNEVMVCAVGSRVPFHRFEHDRFVPATARSAHAMIGGYQTIAEDPHGGIWAAGHNRLLRWDRGQPRWQLFPRLGTPLLRDHANGLWFSGDRRGVVRRHGDLNETVAGARPPVREDHSGSVWLKAADGVMRWSEGRVETHPAAKIGLDKVRLQDVDGAGVVWVVGRDAARSPAVACFADDRWSVVETPPTSREDEITATEPDPLGGLWCVVRTAEPDRFAVWYVGRESRRRFDVPDEVKLQRPPRLFASSDGRVMLYGHFGLFERDGPDGTWNEISLSGRTASRPFEFAGELWVSSLGQTGGTSALMRLGESTPEPFAPIMCHLTGRDADREIHLASQPLGYFVLRPEMRSLPAPIRLPWLSPAGPSIRGPDGSLWLSRGAKTLRYEPDGIPPETVIVPPDPVVSHGGSLQLDVRGLECFVPTAAQNGFRYSWRVDGGAWCDWQVLDGPVEIEVAAAGMHTAEIRVQDADLEIDESPARFEFRVGPVPLQLRPWFRIAVLLLVLALLSLSAFGLLAHRRLRKQAEALEGTVRQRTRELRGSERKYRSLFEQSRDAVLLFNPDGSFHDSNPAARALLAAGSASGLPATMDELFPTAEERDLFRGELAEIGAVQGARLRVHRRGAGPMEALVTAGPCLSPAGATEGYQVIVRDLTRQLLLEERFRQAQKMEALGRMAGGVAHDFNNLLTGILGYAELIKQQVPDRDGLSEDVDTILDTVHRAKELTAQIQTFGQSPALDARIVDVGVTLRAMTPLLRGLAPDGVEVVVELREDVGRVRIPPRQLEQIMVNLVVNAYQSKPKGGVVTVRAFRENVSPAVGAERGIDPGRYVVLEVQDTGVGMDVVTLDKIFDPWFTTKDGGSGLGLAIVYGIVQQSLGHVTVESSKGVGSTFYVHLPHRAEAADSESRVPAETRDASGTERILVVDDEQDIRAMIRRSLEPAGFAVSVAPNADAALDLLQRDREAFDLVITDIVMPGTNGIDFAHRVRRDDPRLPVLLISGWPRSEGGSRQIEELGARFLPKPFDPVTLRSEVRKILDDHSSVTAHDWP